MQAAWTINQLYPYSSHLYSKSACTKRADTFPLHVYHVVRPEQITIRTSLKHLLNQLNQLLPSSPARQHSAYYQHILSTRVPALVNLDQVREISSSLLRRNLQSTSTPTRPSAYWLLFANTATEHEDYRSLRNHELRLRRPRRSSRWASRRCRPSAWRQAEPRPRHEHSLPRAARAGSLGSCGWRDVQWLVVH